MLDHLNKDYLLTYHTLVHTRLHRFKFMLLYLESKITQCFVSR